MSIIKKGFKMLGTHLIAAILSLLILSIFGGVLKTRAGTSFVWSAMLLIYLALIYSEGWNMAAFDRKPYNEIKTSVLRPLKASLITFIIPAILIIVYLIPMNAWRPFYIQNELKAETQYTIVLKGESQAFVDDVNVIKLPEEANSQNPYEAPENILIDGDFENSDSWIIKDAAAVSKDEARSGESSILFTANGEISKEFTAKEDGIHHISGYYKGNGKMEMLVLSDGEVISTQNVSDNIVPLNEQIFTLASNVWYLPLSLLYNNGEGDVTPFHVIYLSLLLPLVAAIGYIVGKTGFSFLDSYAKYKNKRLLKKKAAAEAEMEAIKEQRKRYEK